MASPSLYLNGASAETLIPSTIGLHPSSYAGGYLLDHLATIQDAKLVVAS